MICASARAVALGEVAPTMIDAGDELLQAALDLGLEGRQRDERRVVVVLPHRRLALRRQHADDLERDVLDAHQLADRVGVGAEQLVDDGLAEDARPWRPPRRPSRSAARPRAIGQLRIAKYSGDGAVDAGASSSGPRTMSCALGAELRRGVASPPAPRVWMAAGRPRSASACEPKPPRAPPAVVRAGQDDQQVGAHRGERLPRPAPWPPRRWRPWRSPRPTPMMMPSVVRNERILLRSSARIATRRVCSGFMTAPPAAASAGARNRPLRLLADVRLAACRPASRPRATRTPRCRARGSRGRW